VGQYTEIYFPTHDVRYIAIADGVDTANSQSNDFAALKNVINEFYSRDTSRKIRSAFTARAKEGRYQGKWAPFGYIKDPEDHNHLIPDPETRHWVVEMFERTAAGWGNKRLRDWLREQKVGCPSWFQHKRGAQDMSHMFPTEESRYIWRPDTLRNIIRNQVYMGDMVSGKHTAVFKAKKRLAIPEDDWIVVHDTHEPLVDRELWHKANDLVAVKRQDYKDKLTGYASPFTGILKCYDCGHALSRRRNGSHSDHWVYACTSYATYGKERCSQHHIFEDDLIDAVLNDIHERAQMALDNREGLIASVIKNKTSSAGRSEKSRRSIYNKAQKRLAEIERLLSRLYEDLIAETITKSNFNKMISKYQKEQDELEQTVAGFEHESEELKEARTDAEHAADLLAKYADIDKLSPEVVNALIKRIEVHEVEVVDGQKLQTVDIHYRYIGLLDPCEYEAISFYQTKHVSKTNRKRAARKKNEVVPMEA
jgi:hypothetical protein